MAQINITTTQIERDAVLKALKELEGKTTPVSKLAEMTGLKQSRVRYAIVDLIEEKKIERVPTKAFNKHYVRYSYKVLD